MRPSRTSRKVAFIDMGTNSARMMLVRINPDCSYSTLSERKESIRLGEGEFLVSDLKEEAMDRAFLVVKEFMSMAESRGIEEVVAVATSATCEAKNRRDFFDSAAELKLHRLGEWERELLEYSALLHDIGISLSYDGHHRHSYYFIKHAELLGFNDQEIDIVAATARYHRKSVPRKKTSRVHIDRR